jgi:hypothetical protein
VSFILTQHARDRIAQRGISMDQINQAIVHPDHIEPDPTDPDLEHRILHTPEGTSLRIVCSVTESVRVITAFPDRRLKPKP